MPLLWCVNPLSIGTPISTCICLPALWSRKVVSIPYLSGHPFLRRKMLSFFVLILGVNPLSIGTPISTWRVPERLWKGYWSVNPLSIGTPISTGKGPFIGNLHRTMCQSPIYRDTHFYWGLRDSFLLRNWTVSIPYLSGHPFLPWNPVPLKRWRKKCVNPLSIGTPISTRYSPLRGSSVLCQSPIYRDTHFYN